MKYARFSVVVLLAAYAVCSSAQSAPPDSSNYSATLTNNPVYQKNCAKCHGKTGEGRHPFGGPSLVSEKAIASSPDELIAIITNGKGHMPKYDGKLDKGQIQTLVDEIKAGAPKN